MLGSLITNYNQATRISGEDKIETDLNQYVIDRAIDGMFKRIAAQVK